MSRIVKVGKRFYAPSDFPWFDAPGKDDPFVEIRNIAKEIGRDLFCTFDLGLTPQAGFLKKDEVRSITKKRIYAIAPWVISRFRTKTNAIMVLPVEEESVKGFVSEKDDPEIKDAMGKNLYYGLIVRNGLIYRDVILPFSEMGAWIEEFRHPEMTFVLPVGWDLPGVRLQDIERSIPLSILIAAAEEDEKENFCPFIDPEEERKRLLMIAGGIVAGIVGLFLLKDVFFSKKVQMNFVKQVTHIVIPTATIYPPGPVMSSCFHVFGKIPLRIEGWQLVSIECNSKNSAVILFWHRIYGTISDLRNTERRGTWEYAMDKALETVSYPFPSRVYRETELSSVERESGVLLAFFQRVNNHVNVEQANFLQGINPTIKTAKWDTKFEVNPGDLSSLNGLGISLSDILYDVRKNQWTLKGEIDYAKK